MKKGFTFIELMIVVAILGIITAIFIPCLAKHIACNNPRSRECQKYNERHLETNSHPDHEEIEINGKKYRRTDE